VRQGGVLIAGKPRFEVHRLSGGTGMPDEERRHHRTIIYGILWILSTGVEVRKYRGLLERVRQSKKDVQNGYRRDLLLSCTGWELFRTRPI
jgi:hypothetical protein